MSSSGPQPTGVADDARSSRVANARPADSEQQGRHGTTSLFSALNVATGEVNGKCMRRHRSEEFVLFLNEVDKAIPEEEGVKLHVIMDNYATHKTEKVKRWFAKRPRYHVHFTPTEASWLNQVERFFAEITAKRIRRGVFRSIPQLEKAINDYVTGHNENPKPFTWTATADLILERVKTFVNELATQDTSGPSGLNRRVQRF